jgi:hypothetical protein
MFKKGFFFFFFFFCQFTQTVKKKKYVSCVVHKTYIASLPLLFFWPMTKQISSLQPTGSRKGKKLNVHRNRPTDPPTTIAGTPESTSLSSKTLMFEDIVVDVVDVDDDAAAVVVVVVASADRPPFSSF